MTGSGQSDVDAPGSAGTPGSTGAPGSTGVPGPIGGPARGVLRPAQFDDAAQTLHRCAPPAALAPYVDWLWAVEWDLPTPTPRPAAVLSHPCLHATLEGPGGTRHGQPLPAALVHGVLSRRFDVELTGSGWVAGLRFRPGAYAALTGSDAAALTDRVVRWSGEPPADEPLRRALAAADPQERLAAVADWWLSAVPAQVDATYAVVDAIVTDVADDRALTGVEELAERHSLSVRGLQRLIRWYVGVPPSWLIRRYRLQDALSTLQEHPEVDLSALATELGWYDQAHFTRDFRAAVGQPPATYLRRVDDDAAWRS